MTTIILYALLQFGLSDIVKEPAIQVETNVQYSTTGSDSRGDWDDVN